MDTLNAMINLLKDTDFMESNYILFYTIIVDLPGFTKRHITQYLYIQDRSKYVAVLN